MKSNAPSLFEDPDYGRTFLPLYALLMNDWNSASFLNGSGTTPFLPPIVWKDGDVHLLPLL